MKHLEIDNNKCIDCKLCLIDCPMGITMINKEGKYCSNEKNAELCIYCGHCVTVCPVEAIKLNAIKDKKILEGLDEYGIVTMNLSSDECMPTNLKNIPSISSMKNLIMARRMTRKFNSKLVDKKTVEKIIDVLKYAPSGHNVRGFETIVVKDRKKLEKLTTLTCDCFKDMLEQGKLHLFDAKVFEKIIEAWENEKINRIFRTAPEIIIVHCKNSIVPADPSVKVMLTYFEMLANTMGIGTVWAGYFMVAAGFYKPIKELLGIPKENTVYGSMMFGYPEIRHKSIPKRPDIKIKYI